jgi:hypothetical protein
MLNKINQKNQFMEIRFSASALVAFVFLFQVKVIAQEKESEFKISNAPITVSMLRRNNKIEKNSLNDLWNRFNIYRTQS